MWQAAAELVSPSCSGQFILCCRPAHLSHAGFSTSRVSWCTLRTSSAAVEAAEAQLADAPAASTPTAEQQPAPQQRTKQPARQRNSADASGKSDAIIVQDKPVRNALLRRLEAVSTVEAAVRASCRHAASPHNCTGCRHSYMYHMR